MKVKQKTLAKTIAKMAMLVYNESEPREEEKTKRVPLSPAAIESDGITRTTDGTP